MCPLMVVGDAWKHPWGGIICDNGKWWNCSLAAIFDFAYSMRMAPRSDDSKYLPCNICIAWPALWTSRNSTKATGTWLVVGCVVVPCPPVCANCWIDGWLDAAGLYCVCIRRRTKPGRLLCSSKMREGETAGWSCCFFRVEIFLHRPKHGYVISNCTFFVFVPNAAKVRVNHF